MDRLTTDDWVSVSDFVADYCWRVDEGDGDGWAALWTEDGVFTGVAPEPIVGRNQLRNVPINAFRDYGDGQMRHLAGNLTCRYGADRETVRARFYNFVTVWGNQVAAGNFVMALSDATLVRSGGSWLLSRNDVTLLPR